MSRIITLQRQVRELGRLRAGLTATNEAGKTYPASSKTWILTSPNRAYIDAAASLWGGTVEQWQPQGQGTSEWRVITQAPAIDAVLPPGDPINQAYEMWTGGGCARRCDGETESRSQKPCLCRAQFGEDFHTVPLLDGNRKPQRCQPTTRLSVFLPDLPDIGIWRVESKGYWPGVHMTGYVETIKGLVGPQAMVPVMLAIEPRTKVRDGRTSRYVEIVVALKGSTSFGEIVAAPQRLAIGSPAEARAVEAPAQRAALPSAEGSAKPVHPSAGRRDWIAEAAAADLDGVRALWKEAVRLGAMNPALEQMLRGRVADLEQRAADDDTEPDADEMWNGALAAAGRLGWNTAQTQQTFIDRYGKKVHEASGWELQDYRDHLKREPAGASA